MSEESPASPAPAGDAGTPDRRRKSGLRDSLFMAVLALAAFAVGFGLFNGWVMPQLIHGTGEVQVPDLANLTFEQAEAALQPTGLVLSRAGERFDPGVPRGFVLSQDPPAGTPVRRRSPPKSCGIQPPSAGPVVGAAWCWPTAARPCRTSSRGVPPPRPG